MYWGHVDHEHRNLTADNTGEGVYGEHWELGQMIVLGYADNEHQGQ